MNTAQPFELPLASGANQFKWHRWTVFTDHRLVLQRAKFQPVVLFPTEGTTSLILDHACFEEISFLLQINHLGHPREGIFFLRE